MNSMPFRQLKSFLKILIGVQYQIDPKNQPGFLWREAMRIPAFCCLKGAEEYGGQNGSLLSVERAFIVYLHRKQDFSCIN